MKNAYIFGMLCVLVFGCGQDARNLPSHLQIGEVHEPTQEELERLRHSSNPFLRDAVRLKLTADRNNETDLRILLNRFSKDPIDDVRGFSRRLRAKLSRDLNQAKTMFELAHNGDEPFGSIPFRTSLGKLIRSRSSADDSISGILEDARTLFNRAKVDLVRGQMPRDTEIRHNKITVLKALLLYMVMTRNDRSNLQDFASLVDRLHLVYPESIPREIPRKRFASFGLFTGDRGIVFPNAGYVFGGDPVDGRIKGIDCSAYLSMATDSSVRLFTAYLEYAWLYAQGRRDELDRNVLDNYFHYGLGATLSEYEALDVGSVDDLQAGDLVVWRGDHSGHVSMYTGLTVGDEFVGIEATRKDDKSMEGLHFVRQSLFVEGLATYAFRRL